MMRATSGRHRVIACLIVGTGAADAFLIHGVAGGRAGLRPGPGAEKPGLPKLARAPAQARLAPAMRVAGPAGKMPPPGPAAGPFGVQLHTAFQVAGASTATVWLGCALGALATYKPWRYTHNTIGVTQALAAIPVIWAAFASLAVAAREGWVRLRSPDCRRLNLGLAAASVWSAIAVAFAPAFTSALVRTVDPVIYPLPLRLAALLTHLCTAVLCLSTWRDSVLAPSLARVVSGVLGSRWDVTKSDDPDQAPLFANEYNILSLAFAIFTGLAVFAPFPLATVPSLLGKRMARAFGAWTLMAAVMFYELRSAAQDARLGSGCGQCPVCFMKKGLVSFAFLHLAVGAARLALESADVYPAAMACLPATLASVAVFALAAWTVLRDQQFSGRKRVTQTDKSKSADCTDGGNI